MSLTGKLAASAVLLALASAVGGCSYLNKVTGQTDNTVLPGTREDAIPGKSQFPDDADAPPVQQPDATPPATAETGQKPACGADDPACAQSQDGTFSDPQ